MEKLVLGRKFYKQLRAYKPETDANKITSATTTPTRKENEDKNGDGVVSVLPAHLTRMRKDRAKEGLLVLEAEEGGKEGGGREKGTLVFLRVRYVSACA